jgi:septation ring formation regulator EzrA
MGVLETGIIYGLIGLAVATALVLRSESSSAPARVVLFVMGASFWPLYAPSLLAPEGARGRERAGSPDVATLGERMQAAQSKLLEALAQVEGVAQAVAPEVARVRLVTGQVAEMERRVREIDAVLGTEEFDLAAAREALARISARGIAESDPRHQSIQVRVRNIERLHGIRERTLEDLEKIALKLEEMSSRLKLLRFAGRPDAEVVQLFKEVADSVEDVTEGLMAAAG